MNERFHYEIAVTSLDGRKKLIFRRRIGTLLKIENCAECPVEPVSLVLIAEREKYIFSYVLTNGEEVVMGEGESYLLSTQAAGGFTGVYIGLYATGNGKAATTPAYFDWFD